jgi:hypothetical protein
LLNAFAMFRKILQRKRLSRSAREEPGCKQLILWRVFLFWPECKM